MAFGLDDAFLGAFAGPAISSLVGGLMQSDAADSAANAQVASADKAAETQWRMFNTVNQQNEPYRNVGQSYLNNYFQNDGLKDYFMHQFGANDLNANLAPNWRFGLEQGQKAAAQALNAAGGTGGNYAKGLIDYTIGKSGDLYQQAYNNYTQNQSNIFNRLKSIADYGLGAAGQTAQVAPSFANGIAGAQIGAGNAAASGIVGSANALTGGLSNAASWFSLPQILKQGAGTYSTPPFNPAASGGFDYSGAFA